jgi:Protein of unknown function (DUF1302)
MNKNILQKSALATIVGGVLWGTQIHAADFYFGQNDDILLQVNSQLSVGASWRLKDADSNFIAAVNGGTGATGTTDDGNLNFEKNDTFSKIIKGVHDIQLSKDNYGAFVRFKYWYDKELKDESRPHGHSNNGYQPGKALNDDGFADFTKFSGIELLDAYLYANLDFNDIPVDVRLGRQVISWGESTFIQGGLNSTNPFDVSAFRRPGVELKEGLLPVGMLYASAGLTEAFTVEAFYQYEWEKTQIDGCGTLFSAADFAASGCNAVTIAVDDQTAYAGGFYAQRQADIEPDDGGQYGVAFRYYSEALNDTDFGLYFLNIHSRVPLINGVRTQVPLATGTNQPVFVPRALDPTGGALSALNPAYNIEFPEDLKYYGASFATNISGIALSGEISYKPDTPMQINGPEILNGALSESPVSKFSQRVTSVGYGEKVQGWDEIDVTQLQFTVVQFYERVLGASRLTFIGEVGGIWSDGAEDWKDDSSKQRYGRNAVFGLGNFDLGAPGFNCEALTAAGAVGGDCKSDGYVTDSAYGYRLRAELDYSDLFGGIGLKPSIAWAHDLEGYSPEPGQQFHEGRKALGLSLEASYKQKYTANIGYTSFSGGSHNILEDKDFVSLSFGISY